MWARPVGLACSAILLGGCAGSGEGLDANGQPITPGMSGNLPLTADFESIQANVFTPICTVCHIGAAAPQGLRLDSSDSYNLLVGIPSTEVPSILRVAPGDPDDSYLIQKLEGHAAVGARMPFGGPYLPDATIAVIAQWITNGALPGDTSATPAAVAVTSRAPEPGDLLTESPAAIMIGLNHDIDVSTLDSRAVRIVRIASDGTDPHTEEISARLTVPPANRRALLLWPSAPLAGGHYRVLAAPDGLGVSGLTQEESCDPRAGAEAGARPSEAELTCFDVAP